ncbi:MAG: C25 family cysteine peptidase, partial [Candidatus Hydrogenedentes bacterium]|nr:C25 family cysteine peptidase [Candidatus Hydrogenedentota bacterium]
MEVIKIRKMAFLGLGYWVVVILTVFCVDAFTIEIQVTSSLNSLDIDFSLPKDYKVEDFFIDGNPVSRVAISGAGVEGEVGFPEMPVIRRLFEIPLNVEEVSYSLHSWEYYPAEKLRHILSPVQPSWEKIGNKNKPPFTKADSAYSSGKVYGGEILSVSYFGIVRGRNLFELKIFPLEYNTGENSIRVLKSLKAEVTWSLPKSVKTRDRKYYSPYVDNLWDKVILNKGAFRSFEKAQYNVPTGLLVIVFSGIQNASELPNWLTWKAQRGFKVTLASTTNIGSTNTAIKQYIKNAYENWDIPPTFVVLLGDHPNVPTFQGTAYNNPPTDLYYSTVEGDEYYTPDLWVGRISVADVNQANIYFQKVMKYEKALWSVQENWHLKSSFLAGVDNYNITEGTHNYVIGNYFEPNNFVPERLYVSTYGATPEDVINAVNDGRGWIVYSGHGSESTWQDGPPITQDNIRAFTNTVYPWVLSFACDTGKFTVSECFGETWLRSAGGGIGFLGSSVTSYWNEDDILEKKICETYFGGYTWTAGMILSGKLAYFNYYGNTDTTKRYFEMYNLLGDPSIEIWRGELVEIGGTYPSRILPNGGVVGISVNSSGAVASVSNGSILFGAVRTTIGDNIIHISPIGNTASVILSVTGNPVKPFQVELPVVADSNAVLMWDKSVYGLNSVPQIVLSDADIIGVGSLLVDVTSSTGDNEKVLLTETGSGGNFIGEVYITPQLTNEEDGYLSVSHNGLITVYYYDEFVEGESEHNKMASAVIDLEPPQVTNLGVTPSTTSALIDIETSEVCTAKVGYNSISCIDSMPNEQVSGSLSNAHKVTLQNLSVNTQYAYKITLEDVAGNRYISECAYFRTLRIPDYFTYVYSSNVVNVVPLSFYRVHFIPGNSEDFYTGYIEEVTSFPRDIQNQIVLSMGDDSFQYVEFPLGTKVSLYGTNYTGCYIGSNGFVTFLQGDVSYNESVGVHFSQPRVSLFFD